MALPSTKKIKEAQSAAAAAARGVRPKTEASQLDAVMGAFKMPDLSGVDKQALHENVMEAYTPADLARIKSIEDQRANAAAINGRFGNDMAWLDPQFQVDPALLGTSARSQVHADPELVADQQKALDSLFGIAKDGGATAQERARRAKARGESENWLRGQREADMADLAERGMSGSGAEILALSKDRQDAATRNSAADLETDAWLEQRALDATMRGGELAGQMRDTGFREGQTRAGAQDEFYQLNQRALNDAKQSYADYQRNAHNEMLQRRNDWDKMKLQLGLSTAGGLMSSDVGQGQAGYSYGANLAKDDANNYNDAASAYTGAVTAPNTTKTAYQNQQDAYGNAAVAGAAPLYGDFLKTAASFGGGGAGGAAGGASSGAVNYGGLAQGVATDDDDEKKVGSYA